MAAVASIVLAVVLARMLARPLAEVGGAARRIADGDYAARVPREGPEELASLADSFNQMAASLERAGAMRRDFIANAAHELRTPLTNLQGYLEALRDGVIDGRPRDLRVALGRGRAARPAVALARCAGRGRRGDEPAALVELDLAAAIRTAARARPARRSSGPACGSSSTSRSDLPARANPDHLAQVLANLLSNAVRYTPSGGTVTVRAERRPADLLVSIANTGDGIPADDLDRVFERFYRVEKSRDRARGGAGHRAGHRQAARRGGRRPGRRRVGDGPDAVLVQPPGLTQRGADVGVDHLPAAGGFELEGGHRIGSLHRRPPRVLRVEHLDLKRLDIKRLGRDRTAA